MRERARAKNTAAIGLYYPRAKNGCMGVHVLWVVKSNGVKELTLSGLG